MRYLDSDRKRRNAETSYKLGDSVDCSQLKNFDEVGGEGWGDGGGGVGIKRQEEKLIIL